MTNKVTFGLKNVYYALYNESVSGGETLVTFGTPIPITGAVNLSLASAAGDLQNIAADDDPAYVSIASPADGYTGNIVFYHLPKSFLIDVLGYGEDTSNNFIYKVAGAQKKKFALLYEIGGDQVPTRYVLYKCTPGEFELSTQTNADSVTPNEINIPVTVSAEAQQGLIRAYVEKQAVAGMYENFFTTVYRPSLPPSPKSNRTTETTTTTKTSSSSK